MDKLVARASIEHYRKLLAKETMRGSGKCWGRLLTEEEAKLKPYSGANPEEVIGGLTPWPPMCRPHVDPLDGFCLDPPAQDTPAGEPEGVRPIVVDDG